MLSTSYKFYLSFENSLCGDYITEKFFKVLDYNVIPVVINGVNMTKFAPPNTYIDLKNFKNIEGKNDCFLCKKNKTQWKIHLQRQQSTWSKSVKTINSTLHIFGGEIFTGPPETSGQRFDIKLSFNSSEMLFSRPCAPYAPPSTTTPPPPLWFRTWSSGGKQTPNVAPTLCDNPEECHPVSVIKGCDSWVIDTRCQYIRLILL